MKCSEVRAWLATRRELSWMQEREVQAHLTRCQQCGAAWQLEERTLRQLRSVPVPNQELPKNTELAIRKAIAGKTDRDWQWMYPRLVVAAVISIMLISFVSYERLTSLLEIVRSHGIISGSNINDSSTHERLNTLYVGSHLLGSGVGDVPGEQITAIDVATQHEKFQIRGGYDALLAPDKQKIYVTKTPGVVAIDVQTGEELWQVPVSITGYRPGGLSVLSMSPDGGWLYVANYDVRNGEHGPGWLEIIDTRTHQLLPDKILLPECLAPRVNTPPTGTQVYILCPGQIRILNTETQQIEEEQRTLVSGWAKSLLSPDGTELYLVDTTEQVVILDTQRKTLRSENWPRTSYPLSRGLAVALSGDGTKLVVSQTIQEKFGTDNATLFRIFDTRTWNEENQFRFEQPGVAVAVNYDASMIYAAVPRYMPDTHLVLPADMIVEFNAATGQVEAQHIRTNENIQRLFFGP